MFGTGLGGVYSNFLQILAYASIDASRADSCSTRRQSARISRSLSSTKCSSEADNSPILPATMSCLIVLTMPVTIEGTEGRIRAKP